jgi:hypothetical protein
MQVGPARVRNLADLGVFFLMMVKNFRGVEMNLPGEQHAHNQGMRPDTESRFPPASHDMKVAFP